jgi:hypothetical protein
LQLYILFPRVLCKTIKAKETTKMEHNKEGLAPASPSAQYFNSSALSVSIIAVLESEVPINHLCSRMCSCPSAHQSTLLLHHGALSLSLLMLFTLFSSLYMFQRRKYQLYMRICPLTKLQFLFPLL